MNFDFMYMIGLIPDLLAYLPIVLFMAVVGFVFANLLGLAFAWIIMGKVKLLYPPTLIFISFLRGIPSLVLLFIIYFGIPQVFPVFNTMTALTAAIVALSIRNAAFLSEVFRAAIDAIDKGQQEAALSMGMTKFQGLYRIVLPQAAKVAIPSAGNFFIDMIKETSLAFTIGITEIMGKSKLISAVSYRFFEAFLAAGLIYWALTIVFSFLQSKLEGIVDRPYRK